MHWFTNQLSTKPIHWFSTQCIYSQLNALILFAVSPRPCWVCQCVLKDVRFWSEKNMIAAQRAKVDQVTVVLGGGSLICTLYRGIDLFFAWNKPRIITLALEHKHLLTKLRVCFGMVSSKFCFYTIFTHLLHIYGSYRLHICCTFIAHSYFL